MQPDEKSYCAIRTPELCGIALTLGFFIRIFYQAAQQVGCCADHHAEGVHKNVVRLAASEVKEKLHSFNTYRQQKSECDRDKEPVLYSILKSKRLLYNDDRGSVF